MRVVWTTHTRLAISAYANMKRTRTSNRINLMFRAFSDPTRLRILNLLNGGEMCVGDLVTVLRVPQPTASRHLAYLRRAGLVVARKEGPWSYYSLAPVQSPFHGNLLHCLGTCFGEVPEIQADAGRAEDLRRSGGCCPP
jgi:ArsR family transcriptional regulator, arsenate/arsenite/antimonite-responsive transcriptional repressor